MMKKTALGDDELGHDRADDRQRDGNLQRAENIRNRERKADMQHLARASGAQRTRQLDQLLGRRHQACNRRDNDGKERDQKRDHDARQIGCAERDDNDRRDRDDRRRLDDDEDGIEGAG
jgi:hypothetical protein